MSAEPRQDDTARTTLASPVAAAQLARPEDGTGVLIDGTTSSPYYGSKAEALVAVKSLPPGVRFTIYSGVCTSCQPDTGRADWVYLANTRGTV